MHASRFTYFPWTQQGGRLQTILAQKSGVPTYQNLSFSYDEVGNVRTLTNTVAGETLNFTYDNLNRLDLATGAYNEIPHAPLPNWKKHNPSKFNPEVFFSPILNFGLISLKQMNGSQPFIPIMF